jgi:hypothetical protein
MPNQRDRIILDTNIWISFLLAKDISKLDELISQGKVTFILSQELVDEFIEVTQRNKFKKYFDLNDVESLLVKIKDIAAIISVKSKITVCRDAKDDFLLSLALDGNATHLITGDKDLLILNKFGKTKILTITEYLQINAI